MNERELGDVLSLARVAADVNPRESYKQITLRLYGRGAVLRKEVLGSQAGSAKYMVRQGQLLVSKIDARGGAIALVPQDLDGAIVSRDFVAFDIDATQILPEYLDAYSKTPEFVEMCGRASEGTTNRIRLSESSFLRLRIHIPSLPVQQKIVRQLQSALVDVDALVEGIADLRDGDSLYRRLVRSCIRDAITQEGTDSVDSLEASRRKYAGVVVKSVNSATPGLGEPSSIPFDLPQGWRWVPLRAICTHIVDCVNDTPSFSTTPTPYLGLKTTNVRPNRIVLDQKWYVSEKDYHHWNRRMTPTVGDIVLTREAPMGMVARYTGELAGCLTQRLMLLRTDPEFVLPEFLVHVLNDPSFLSQAINLSRSTPPHLRVRDVPNLAVPYCEPAEQRRFVSTVDAGWSKLRELGQIVGEQEIDLRLLPGRLRQELLGGTTAAA